MEMRVCSYPLRDMKQEENKLAKRKDHRATVWSVERKSKLLHSEKTISRKEISNCVALSNPLMPGLSSSIISLSLPLRGCELPLKSFLYSTGEERSELNVKLLM